ncbi:reverse transcriptase domain-containing protein [Tanacetum coccineum]
MHTRSQTRNLHNQQHQAPPAVVEPFNLEDPFENHPPPPPPPMDDQRTMAQLLEAPTEGYEDAIVVPEINANFELKHGLINLVQNKQFFGHDKEDPHAHIRYFNKITSTMKFPNVPTTSGNVYRDNIQEYVSQAAAANFNQGNTGYRTQISNQIRPPGFPPVQNHQNQGNNQNRYNQNRGNFNQAPAYQPPVHQGQVYRPQVVQPPAYQAPAYQPPAPQIQGVSKEDFHSYVKANDAVMRNMQTQGQNMQNQLTNLTDMLSKFVASNTASTSGTLPSNTVTNPKEDLKASIPFPSRRNDERRREKANDQIEKFYEIFQDLSFEISFTDALMLMPKFASTLKTLIGNKEKLSEMARTPLNENCSAVILNKLPKKLGDPGRFLIPCEFSGINTCNALADLGASINLMPYSVWKTLSLSELTPTCMTLELADRSISEPIGIAEDVYVTVGKFQFPADFVVVDFEPDPRVPLILGRSFLNTSRVLIDVYEGEITLRIGREAITFNLDQTSSGNPTPYYDPIVSTSSPTLTPFGDSDFLLFEEADSFLALEGRINFTWKLIKNFITEPEGDIILLDAIINSEPLPHLFKENYFTDNKNGSIKRVPTLLKFHNVPDAKSLWDAIKSRFGGNDESKKMQRNVLKHQFENFTTAPNESLDKAYDRFQKLISQLEVHAAPVSREDINQKFLRSLPPSWSQIALIMRNKPDIDQTDIDDLYNNLRVYEDEMKRSSSSTSNSQNLAFLSSENTSSTNEVSTASGNFGVNTAGGTNSSSQVSSTPGADEVVCSFFAQQTTSPPLDNEDLQQIDQDDLEELDIRWQVAMLTVRVQRFIKKTGRNLDFKGKQPVTFDKSQVECYNCHRKGHFAKECKSGWNQGKRSNGDNGRRNATNNEPSSQALVAQDGLGGYDWSNDFDEPVNYALMAISSSSSSSSSDNEVQNCSKQCLESFKTLQKNYDSEREKHNRARLEIQGYELALESLESRILGHEKNELAWGEKYESSDEENTPTNDSFSKVDGFHAVSPPITEKFLTPRADISFAGKTNEANTQKLKTIYESVNKDKVIEDWNSDDEDDVSEVQTVSPVKTNKTQIVKTRVDKIGQTSQKQGIGFKKIKARFFCKSTNHLIKDCTFHDRQSQEPKLKTVVNTGPRLDKPVWDNTKRVNHQKISKYPHLRKTFVPSGVLTRTGLITPVKQNEKRAVHKDSTTRPVSTARLVSTARPVSTVRPFASKIAQTSGAIRPIYPRMDNVRPRGSYSPIKRSYYTKPAFRPKDLKQDVKTFGVQNITTAGTRAVVNTSKGKMDTDLKKSRANPKILYKDHPVVDIVISFLEEMSEFVLRAPRKDDVYSLDLKNIVPSGEVVEDKSSSDKGGNAEEQVSTARPEVSTIRPDIDAARQEDGVVEPRTPPTTTSIFDDEDITMAQTLIKMKEEKAKEKGVSIKDVDDSSRPARSSLTLKPLVTIDPKDRELEWMRKQVPEDLKALRIMFEETTDDDIWKNQEKWIIKSWTFYENYGVHILKFTCLQKEDLFKNRLMSLGAKMRVRRIFECWFSDHTTNGYQFTMSNKHQELARPEANGFCKELASPKQKALGKDISNPLIVLALTKNYMVISAPCYSNEVLAIPEQTATGKEISNLFMADLQEEAAPAGEQSGPPAPKTAKQLTAKRNQERVKSILLLAIPDEYLLKFHNVPDAKSLWAAIKSSLDKAYDRFQKLISQLEVHAAPVSKEDINQKFLRSLPPSWSQIALIMRNKPDIDQTNIDDLYNNLRVYEDEMKRSSSSTSNSQNLAFLSSKNTSSTNEVSTASGNFGVNTAGGTNSSSQVSSTPGVDEVVCSFFAQQTTSPPLDNEDLQQIDQDDLEELDIRWQVAMLTVRVQRFIQKTGRNLDFKGKQLVTFDKSNVECYNCHRKGHFAKECKSGRNQGKRSYGYNDRRNATTNEPSSQALVAQDGLGGYD